MDLCFVKRLKLAVGERQTFDSFLSFFSSSSAFVTNLDVVIFITFLGFLFHRFFHTFLVSLVWSCACFAPCKFEKVSLTQVHAMFSSFFRETKRSLGQVHEWVYPLRFAVYCCWHRAKDGYFSPDHQAFETDDFLLIEQHHCRQGSSVPAVADPQEPRIGHSRQCETSNLFCLAPHSTFSRNGFIQVMVAASSNSMVRVPWRYAIFMQQ